MTLIFAVLATLTSAQALERGAAERLRRAESDVGALDVRLNRIGRGVDQRRGLIGADEAVQRYEDGVYAYLVGEYERAALSFYTLVELHAIDGSGLTQDSEWYLAESLFELKNWATALDAYTRVVNAGPQHPFFADAVRRQLEIYGILRDTDSFFRVYRDYILTNRVPSTDAVKYTMAKSFYRQNEAARAKALLSELPVDSEYYGRGRYVMGTIMAGEGDVKSAVAEFLKVEGRAGQEDPEVQEQTWLALGRCYYELGEYAKGTEYYRRIQPTSKNHADQLYELAWTYIKQEKWDEAQRQVEMFLLSFPSHAYTMQMKLVQGHLFVKSKLFENALVSYEALVKGYSPLRDELKRIESSREAPEAFFRRLVESEGAASKVEAVNLPDFAGRMLVERDEMGRAVEARSAVNRQGQDIVDLRGLASEIERVLSENKGGGAYAQSYSELLRFHDGSIRASLDLLALEMELLKGAGVAPSSTMKPRIDGLAAELDKLPGGDKLLEKKGAMSFFPQVLEASAVSTAAYGGSTLDIPAARAALEQRRGSLLPSVAVALDQELGALSRPGAVLTPAEAEARRSAVIAAMGPGGAPIDPSRTRISKQAAALHVELRGMRTSTADPELVDAFNRLDSQWARIDAALARLPSIEAQLAAAEAASIASLGVKLAGQKVAINGLAGRWGVTEKKVSDVGARITRSGFVALEQQVYSTIMQADMGVVDVYWLRKSEVNEEITRLSRERSSKLQELDSQFNLIRQQMEK